MSRDQLLGLLDIVSAPPPGSVNVRFGRSVEGPGGRWVPCVSQVSGTYYPGLFRVGPGQRQVCAATAPFRSADEALQSAIELASSAAA